VTARGKKSFLVASKHGGDGNHGFFFAANERKERKRLFGVPASAGWVLQMSLFEQVAEDGLNSEEQSVAWYFEKQGQLLWWYRNLSRQDYRLQGWRKNGIYPDFIVSRTSPADKTDFDKVFVVESKGIHLKNDDTDYKKQVFKLCNKLAEQKSWMELGLEFPEHKIVFELVYGDEWQKVLNRLLN
jgi:type III restriction enzyme